MGKNNKLLFKLRILFEVLIAFFLCFMGIEATVTTSPTVNIGIILVGVFMFLQALSNIDKYNGFGKNKK